MADIAISTKLGLQKYDTGKDYDLDPVMPKHHQGYGSGKCGTYEVSIPCGGKDAKIPLLRPIIFNPVVTIVGLGVLFAFAGYCIAEGGDAKTTLGEWQSWCTEVFTWLYIGSQDIWIFFLIAVYYYYGDRKLGKDDDKPEFTNVSYFAMVFSCGVAVGLFVYGTAEPLYHYDYWYKHSLNGGGYETDNDKANYAILTTTFHWGFHGWVVYSLVAIQMGIMAFRYNLPMTMRSCFYPLLGRHTWGWIGDLIDGFSIVTIIAGVCTSLGLGAGQIRRGLEGLGAWDSASCDSDCADGHLLWIIWSITAIATVSVVTGLHVGIKTLSQLAFYLGCFLLLFTILYGDTWFYLNVMVEQTGLYMHYALTVLGWRTDAFAQLSVGQGDAPDGLGASESFMDGWTIFYWGWWIAWSPFVGSFVARISRGRTIREVLNFTMTVPLGFVIIWFSTFGGAAIQMEWKAHRLHAAGLELYNDPSYFQAGQHGREMPDFASSYAAGPVSLSIAEFGTNCSSWQLSSETTYCSTKTGYEAQVNNADGCVPAGAEAAAAAGLGVGCGACFDVPSSLGNATHTGCEIWKDNPKNAAGTCPAWIDAWSADTRYSPACLFSDWDQDASWYNLFGQFGALAPFLQGLSIFTLVCYFVTSSDSGSLIVDTLAANGRDEQNPLQRIIWAVIEGLVATSLVLGSDDETSSKDVLKALQAASICSGLPFTIMLCFMMPATWYGLARDGRDVNDRDAEFSMPVFGGVFDVMDVAFSLGKAPAPSSVVWKETLISFALPPFQLMAVLNAMTQKGWSPRFFGSQALGAMLYAAVNAGSVAAFIIFHFMQLDDEKQGYWAVAWCFYLVFVSTIATLRYRTRVLEGIGGNYVEDFFATLFLYPQVLTQLSMHYVHGKGTSRVVDDDGKADAAL